MENRVGYVFNDDNLLTEALTHSLDNEDLDQYSTEKNKTFKRLTAIGDQVLKFLASHYVIASSELVDEGVLTRKRQAVINVETMQNEIGSDLILIKANGRGRLHTCVRISTGNLTNPEFKIPFHQFVKSVLGAVFVDAGGWCAEGIRKTKNVFTKLWKIFINSSETVPLNLVSRFPVPPEILKFWKKYFDAEFSNSSLEYSLQYTFRNNNLLSQALIHKSFYDPIRNDPVLKNLHQPDYQRLEFLGDSVLGVIIMEFLFHKFPDANVEYLHTELASNVNHRKLAHVAKKLRLAEFVLTNQDLNNDYSDIVESVIGAMYVDGGIGKVKEFIIRVWELDPTINNIYYESAYMYQPNEPADGYTGLHTRVLEKAPHPVDFASGEDYIWAKTLYASKKLINSEKANKRNCDLKKHRRKSSHLLCKVFTGLILTMIIGFFLTLP